MTDRRPPPATWFVYTVVFSVVAMATGIYGFIWAEMVHPGVLSDQDCRLGPGSSQVDERPAQCELHCGDKIPTWYETRERRDCWWDDHPSSSEGGGR